MVDICNFVTFGWVASIAITFNLAYVLFDQGLLSEKRRAKAKEVVSEINHLMEGMSERYKGSARCITKSKSYLYLANFSPSKWFARLRRIAVLALTFCTVVIFLETYLRLCKWESVCNLWVKYKEFIFVMICFSICVPTISIFRNRYLESKVNKNEKKVQKAVMELFENVLEEQRVQRKPDDKS